MSKIDIDDICDEYVRKIVLLFFEYLEKEKNIQLTPSSHTVVICVILCYTFINHQKKLSIKIFLKMLASIIIAVG